MNELAVFDPIDKTLAEYEAENKSLTFEYETPEGNKSARSHVYKLRLVKGKIVAAHKQVKAEALAYGRKCDAKKNECLSFLEKLIAVHNEPLLLIEKEKADTEAERLRKIKEAEEKAERERTEELERREAEVRAREEKVAAEEAAKRAAEEAAKAEAERLAWEKQVAEAAKAQAEADAKIALEAAEAKRLIDVAAAKAKAEQDTRDKEYAELRRLEEEEAEKERLAEIERKRQANKKHQQEVHAGIRQRLFEIGLEKKQVEAVLDALIAGTIPHVKIEY